jgi:hypothetical protein
VGFEPRTKWRYHPLNFPFFNYLDQNKRDEVHSTSIGNVSQTNLLILDRDYPNKLFKCKKINYIPVLYCERFNKDHTKAVPNYRS